MSLRSNLWVLRCPIPENPWQGGPPHSKSKPPFFLINGRSVFSITVGDKAVLMSPSSRRAFGKFAANESAASSFNSLNAMHSNPAHSSPRVSPPQPAKRSTDVSFRMIGVRWRRFLIEKVLPIINLDMAGLLYTPRCLVVVPAFSITPKSTFFGLDKNSAHVLPSTNGFTGR